MFKRFFDIVFSFLGLLLLFPFLLIISLIIIIESCGGIFYKQKRVGRNNRDFSLIKFRSMRKNSDKDGFLTIGANDERITKSGYYLRKYKLDEIPQLINILKSEMSFVGPRPEVRKYVDLYNKQQRKVLKVKPGLTDYASIEYFKESEILSSKPDPEKAYINEIMPAKLNLNLKYIDEKSFLTDFRIIIKTIKKIFH
ncbi:MAG: sugar transferase [Bacteroidales bacterium]|nr:sugar transferase [Bacteroidales bacterium]